MRSIAAVLRNKAPVPFTTGGSGMGLFNLHRSDPEAYMKAMGSVGTLFSIVNRTSTGTSKVEWHLYRKARSGKDEDRTEVTSHACIDLWNHPNDFMTRQEYVESVQQHVDLTGEGWPVYGRNPLSKLPLELWFVRPDRIAPVKHKTKFIAGYEYTTVEGEKIPLDLDQASQIRMPNPLDPYRGMGPVQSLMVKLDSMRYTAEWNRNFFKNSALPSGIIEVDRRLGDDEWREMMQRWQESHQGVANAHRVAIVEEGKWVDSKFSMRDMQFAELDRVSRDQVHEAFGMPQFMTGNVTDVNRATADAADVMFARWIIVPRLDRWKGWLNNDLLPLFGRDMAREYEWDYESPVPEDIELENASRKNAAETAAILIGLGYDEAEVCEWLNIPKMKFTKPEPPTIVAPPGTDPDEETEEEPAPPATNRTPWLVNRPRRLVAEIDITQVQRDWEVRLDALIRDWAAIAGDQRAQLADQIRVAVNSDDLNAIAALAVSTTAGVALLTEAMVLMSEQAGRTFAAEAAAQGVQIEPPGVDELMLAGVAVAVATLLATGLANSAGREALRLYTPRADGDDVATQVTAFLSGLSDAFLRDQLGGALTRAQNLGRFAAASVAPPAEYRATEQLDAGTCGPCREVDGRVYNTITDAFDDYAAGPYWKCEGRTRCRGTFVATWK